MDKRYKTPIFITYLNYSSERSQLTHVISELRATLESIDRQQGWASLLTPSTYNFKLKVLNSTLSELYAQIQKSIFNDNTVHYTPRNVTQVREKFDSVLSEAVDTLPLGDDNNSLFEKILSSPKPPSFTEIISIIATILTIINCILSLLPDPQTEETNKLLKKQNELIEESNKIGKETNERLDKIIELQEQCIEILSELPDISTENSD